MSAINFRIKLQKLDDIVRREHGSSRRLVPAEERILDRTATEIVRYIRSQWPVDTGTSRAAWAWRTSASPGDYAINLTNRMHYASFVHYRGSPKAPGRHGKWLTPSVFEEVVPEAWGAVRDRFYREMTREIERTERQLQAQQPQIGLVQIWDIFHPWIEAAL